MRKGQLVTMSGNQKVDFFFDSLCVVLVLLPVRYPLASQSSASVFVELLSCLKYCVCHSRVFSLFFSPSSLSSMSSLSFWCSPFILPGRDETLTFQALPIWSIQVYCHQVALTKDPFSPVCVFMNLFPCLSALVRCWVEVPVTSGSVCNQSILGEPSLIHMPPPKHPPLKCPVSVLRVFCSCLRHNPSKYLYREFPDVEIARTRLSRDKREPVTSDTGNDYWTGLDAKKVRKYKAFRLHEITPFAATTFLSKGLEGQHVRE